MMDETALRVTKEKSLKRYEPFKALSRAEQKRILSIPSNLLFLHYSPEKILQISKTLWKTEAFHYTVRNQYFLTVEIISKRAFSLGYFLAKLSKLNLVNMDICKLSNEEKFFRLDFKEKLDEYELPRVEKYIEEGFDADMTAPTVAPSIQNEEIVIDCDHSKSYALLKLNTRDQRGLIAYLITLFDALQIDIVTAKIHTQKKLARDLFLMEKNGNFCHNRDTIIEKLTKGK
jgi:[protein-PII] uridylyltransferase